MTIADTFNHPSMLDLALRQELLPLECLRVGIEGLILDAPEKIKFDPPPWDPPQVIAARNLVLIPPTPEELKLLSIL